MQNEARGVIDHMAFSLSNLESVVDALNHHEIEFELRWLEDLQIWRLFCHDRRWRKGETRFFSK
jgi:hypothetical protein